MDKRHSVLRTGNVTNEEAEAFARGHGADLFGVADLSPARDFIAKQCAPLVRQFPRAISMGMTVSDVVLELTGPNDPNDRSLYRHHIYDVITRMLDVLAYNLTRFISRKGFKAFAVPGSSPYDVDRLKGVMPHKLAAHLAGLGSIGKNCLLITELYGPRVRLVTVLTDAPLAPGEPLDTPCGTCRVCVDRCPVDAFTGVEFKSDEDREVRYDAFKCMEFRRTHPCGVCVSSCPKGKLGARKRAKARQNVEPRSMPPHLAG